MLNRRRSIGLTSLIQTLLEFRFHFLDLKGGDVSQGLGRKTGFKMLSVIAEVVIPAFLMFLRPGKVFFPDIPQGEICPLN